MEEDRATPIFMLPGQSKIEKKAEDKMEDVGQDTQKEMIKMEIKKKEPKCENQSANFNITIDFASIILLGALFLASFLDTSHLGFLPDSLRSNLFIFSITKTFLLFCAFLFFKNYFFAVDEN